MQTYLLTIASRLALDSRRKRREELDDGASLLTERDQTASPEVRTIERAELRLVEAAIAELPPEQRDVLLLREVHGFEYEQIGQALGVELGTVRSRLARARASVKARVQPQEGRQS